MSFRTFAVSGAGLQRIVRGYVTAETTLPDPPKVKPPLPGEGGTAFISWGAGSNMSVKPGEQEQAAANNPPVKHGHVESDLGADKTKPEPHPRTRQRRRRRAQGQDKQPGVISMDMLDCQIQTGKIYSPDDKDVWVKEGRMTSIRFKGAVPYLHTDARGRQSIENAPIIYKFNIKHPPWPKPPKDPDDEGDGFL
jgi:hypothetical protein